MGLKSKSFDAKAPSRYQLLPGQWVFTTTASVTGKHLGPWPFSAEGKIVDIIFSQPIAGAGGTSVALTVKKNGTSVCTTDALLALTDGNRATVDSSLKAEITKPAGATRPVLKTDTTVNLAKGDDLTFDVTTVGTYSVTFPEVTVTVVVDGRFY